MVSPWKFLLKKLLVFQNFNINKFNVHILKTQKISKFVFTVYAWINMCLVLIFTFHVIISWPTSTPSVLLLRLEGGSAGGASSVFTGANHKNINITFRPDPTTNIDISNKFMQAVARTHKKVGTGDLLPMHLQILSGSCMHFRDQVREQ